MTGSRLVLLDRDGVLNEDRPDFVKTPGELVMIPGAAGAVARLNRAGVKVALVSNQSVVGRGIIGPDMLDAIHRKLRDELARGNAHLDDLLVCCDAPDNPTPRRKPSPGMLLDAIRTYRAEAAQTWMIGDDLRDLQAAKAAGCVKVLVRTGKGAAAQAKGLPEDLLPVSVFDSLAAAVTAYLETAPQSLAENRS